MARIDILAPFVLSFEGGYANVKGDRGGVTNKGVTIETWRRYGYDKNGDRVIDRRDMGLITEYDAIYVIMKPIFWDKWKADDIRSQSIANLLVDWYWNSGAYGIKIPQSVLGVSIDGVVGPKTIAAINGHPDERELFRRLWVAREEFFKRVAVGPQKKFLKGWLNRLNGIQYGYLKCNGGKRIDF